MIKHGDAINEEPNSSSDHSPFQTFKVSQGKRRKMVFKMISVLSLLMAVAFATFIGDVNDCLDGYSNYTPAQCVADKIKIYSVAANAAPEIKIGEMLNQANQAKLTTQLLSDLLTALTKKNIVSSSPAITQRIQQNMRAGLA